MHACALKPTLIAHLQEAVGGLHACMCLDACFHCAFVGGGGQECMQCLPLKACFDCAFAGEEWSGLLAQLSALAAPGSRLCFDALHADYVDGRSKQQGLHCVVPR